MVLCSNFFCIVHINRRAEFIGNSYKLFVGKGFAHGIKIIESIEN